MKITLVMVIYETQTCGHDGYERMKLWIDKLTWERAINNQMHMCMGVVLVGIMYPPPDGNYSAFFFVVFLDRQLLQEFFLENFFLRTTFPYKKGFSSLICIFFSSKQS